MIKIVSLSSGSCGNAILLTTSKTNILIDAGLPISYLDGSLRKLDKRLDQIDAILITHEHSDHVSSLEMISKRIDIPIYVNYEVIERLPKKYKDMNLRVFPENDYFRLTDLDIYSFSTSHDSMSSVGFCFYNDDHKVAIVTDLGIVSDLVIDALIGYDAMLIESNHDLEMLQKSVYPPFLKKRVRGTRGHLSNDEAAEAIAALATGREQKVLLGHLSQENNTPLKALDTVSSRLKRDEIDSINLKVAPRKEISSVITL